MAIVTVADTVCKYHASSKKPSILDIRTVEIDIFGYMVIGNILFNISPRSLL